VADPPLRVLTVTTLFPSAANPRHGVFVETRLRKLRECAPVDLQVVAPVPWFPLNWPIWGRYATYAATPRLEQRHGIVARHPRFISIPRVGMALQPAALLSACLQATGELAATGWSCDVIDAHYLYPDAVAASILAVRLRRPLIVTARGSDVNLIAQMPGPRRRILSALTQATRVITVSQALRRAVVDIGVPDTAVEVLRNGVDTDLFKPVARESTRARLAVREGPLIASVGNLVPEKGHDLVLRAARMIKGAHVVVVGQGPQKANLLALARTLGMPERVRIMDNVPQMELASIYSAADVLALGSVREGWPNVLLEAMACGTPVVATAVGGVAEIVTDVAAGEVVPGRDEVVFAAALGRVLDRRAERSAVRAHAMKFEWAPIVRRYYEILVAAAQHHVVAEASTAKTAGAMP
jgi:glycosyltransferase involved in cell wall biosynthesis